MINKLNPYLENFGMVPYMYLKVKANDKTIKKRLIYDFLKTENIDNHEKYLENKFADYDYFYAIDINFWNYLMDENGEAPDYINNSRIAEEIIIVKEEEKMEEEIRIIQNKKEKRKFNKDENNILKNEKNEPNNNLKEKNSQNNHDNI